MFIFPFACGSVRTAILSPILDSNEADSLQLYVDALVEEASLRRGWLEARI